MMTQVPDTPQALYRALPSMDSLLADAVLAPLLQRYGKAAVKAALDSQLRTARELIAQERRLPAWCANPSLLNGYLMHSLCTNAYFFAI